MSKAVSTYGLVGALKEQGFPLPDECREARLVMGSGSAFMLQTDQFLTTEDLGKIGRALVKMSEVLL